MLSTVERSFPLYTPGVIAMLVGVYLLEFMYLSLPLSSTVDETWSAPLSSFNSFIDFPTGRMGHTSSYIAETGLIYVHGGYNAGGFVRALLTYHPSSRVWSEWTRSPLPQTFHSTTILGSLLVSFGGKTNGSCIGNNTVIYNIGACVLIAYTREDYNLILYSM